MNNTYLLPALATIALGCSVGKPQQQQNVAGLATALGGGTVSTYATLDVSGRPLAIGVAISGDALTSPPAEMSDGLKCYDNNGDGAIEDSTECFPMHEKVIPLPDMVSARTDVPFKWVLFDWNPMGHQPPGIYSVPHFDVHFMIAPVEHVFAIAAGTCGEGVRCDQYQRAKKPLPDGFMHPDFQDVDAVVPGMGNHLIDVTSHEFHGSPFNRTWIYGTYDGQVTFYEEMVARDYLMSKPEECVPIKTTPAVEIGGLYPTQSCVRYDARQDRYTISMEGFEPRAATTRPRTVKAS